jgi:hypothetical protein
MLTAAQRALRAHAGALSMAAASADALLELSHALRRGSGGGGGGGGAGGAPPHSPAAACPADAAARAAGSPLGQQLCALLQQHPPPAPLCWAPADAVGLHESLAAGDLSTPGLRATLNAVVKAAACLLP